jgi:hypothetical protein
VKVRPIQAAIARTVRIGDTGTNIVVNRRPLTCPFVKQQGGNNFLSQKLAGK